MDNRLICDCSSYTFPHRIGGKCDGSVFTEYYYLYEREYCDSCNCNVNGQCEITTGQESIKEAECYADAYHSYPGEHLTLKPEF